MGFDGSAGGHKVEVRRTGATRSPAAPGKTRTDENNNHISYYIRVVYSV